MAERVTVEHNGEMITLEVPDGTTDEEITSFLTGSTAEKKQATSGDVARQTAQALAPAAMYGPTGFDELGQVVKAAVSPYASASKEALSKTAQIYKAMPMLAPAIDAAGVATLGFPPIAGGQQAIGALDKYSAVKEGAKAVSQELSKGAPGVTPVKGLPTFETIGPYTEMRSAATPEFSKKIQEAYGLKTGGGGNNAVKALLASAEGKAAMEASPELAAAAQKYLQAVPGVGSQAMKTISPFLKGAGKVLGPAGMAMNLYDAQQMAQESQLGQRLQQGQGQSAEQAFRNLNTKYGNAMTPQEAQAVMASGSQRDIEAFGGADRLKQLIRQKAAQRVLGQ